MLVFTITFLGLLVYAVIIAICASVFKVVKLENHEVDIDDVSFKKCTLPYRS